MREFLDDGNRGDIQGVARVGLEGANAALAEDDLIISAGHNVLGGKQQLFESGRDAALEQDRLAHLAQLTQQIEILHVARAYLENIYVRQHQLDLRDLHDFADDQQSEFIARLAQQLESFQSEPLKGIR